MQPSVCLQSCGCQASALLSVFFKATRKPLRWPVLSLLTLMAILAVPSQAQAQITGEEEMLFLSTTETQGTGGQNINNAWPAFETEAVNYGLTPIDGRGLLSSAAALPITPDTKLIVIVTGYNTINSVPMAELQNVIQNDPNLAIVIFSESCSSTVLGGALSQNCANSQQNLQGFMAAVSAIQPSDWPVIKLGTGTSANYTALLNRSSLYASTFSNIGLTTMVAGNYTPIVNVPLDYALYTQTALPSPPPPIVTQNVVGLFIPQTASNSGQGACLFLTADASEFANNHPDQYPPIASSFTTAALDSNGACAQPVAGAPDLWPTLSGLTSLSAGVATNVTLIVHNADQAASDATTVTLTLPPGVNLASPPSGCTVTPSGFTCPVLPLNPNGSTSFDFSIIAPNPISEQPLSVEVTPVPGEINTTNNTLNLLVSAPGSPDLSVDISGPSNLTVNSPATYKVTVINEGTLESNDGTVNITLPGGTKLDPSLLMSNCTPISDTSFTCELANIAQAKSATVTIPFTLTATQTFNNQPIQVDVKNVSGELAADLGNNSTAMDISAALAKTMGALQPVPTLAELALLLLALIVVGSAAVRLRYKG